MANMAMGSIDGSQYLGERFGLTANQAGFGLGDFSIEGTVLNDACPKVIQLLVAQLFFNQSLSVRPYGFKKINIENICITHPATEENKILMINFIRNN